MLNEPSVQPLVVQSFELVMFSIVSGVPDEKSIFAIRPVERMQVGLHDERPQGPAPSNGQI